MSDSAQYENSCPVMFVFSVRHVETRGAFPHIFDISDKSPRVCFIEKHKQHFIDILLFMEATKMKKFNNCVILSQLFFCNGEFISHCILCNYLLCTWS